MAGDTEAPWMGYPLPVTQQHVRPMCQLAQRVEDGRNFPKREVARYVGETRFASCNDMLEQVQLREAQYCDSRTSNGVLFLETHIYTGYRTQLAKRVLYPYPLSQFFLDLTCIPGSEVIPFMAYALWWPHRQSSPVTVTVQVMFMRAVQYSLSLLLMVWLIAPASASHLDGRSLYEENCAACHGLRGFGGVGVPLALEGFQRVVTDEYLRKTIRLGRPGRVMPSFTRLSDEEVNAIIAYVRSWNDLPPPHYPDTPLRGDAERGKSLFTNKCAACHGLNGYGGQGTGVTFSRPREAPLIAPALNNPGFLAAASDAMIRQTLLNGRKGTPMPSAKELGLSKQDVNDVVAYVRSFATRTPSLSAPENEPVYLMVETDISVEQAVENVKRAVLGVNFRLIRVQYLNQGLVPEGQENHNQAIVYFCNFDFLYEALAIDPRIGIFLPCRITIVREGGRTLLMAVNPKRMSVIFNNSELTRACGEMKGIYEQILDEASL